MRFKDGETKNNRVLITENKNQKFKKHKAMNKKSKDKKVSYNTVSLRFTREEEVVRKRADKARKSISQYLKEIVRKTFTAEFAGANAAVGEDLLKKFKEK